MEAENNFDRQWNSLGDWDVIFLNCQSCGKKIGFTDDEPEYKDDFEGLILCADCDDDEPA